MSPRLSFMLPVLLLGLAALLHGQDQDRFDAYRLKANDQISLTVFQEPELMTQASLTLNGEASFPLIGPVRLEGLSLSEAEQKIAALYNADYLVEPRLSVNLVSASAERVSVIGAVRNPGQLAIPPNAVLDLASAIDWSGGVAAHAEPSRIELKRGGSTKLYDLRRLTAPGSAQVILEHGDTINVPVNPFANKTVTITGFVKNPGAVMFPPSGRLDLQLAIDMAGGMEPGADAERITVSRGGNVYSASLQGGNDRLAPGDIVAVPASRFFGKVVTVMGRVARPGEIPFPTDGRLDVLSAVVKAGDFARLANKKKVIVTRRSGEEDQTWTLDLTDMAEGKAELFFLEPGDTLSVPERRF